MARKPKSAAEPTKSNDLLEALRFVSLVTKDIGPINETHVMLQNKTVSAFNSVLAAGCSITDDLYACPQNKLMIEALSKCGQNLAITQLDNNRLSVKSDKFKAIVPCVEQFLLQPGIPDQPIAVIDDRFKLAMDAIASLNSEDGQGVAYRSVLMNGYSIIATIGTVIFEAWHGIHLPPNIPLPKLFVQPLIKTTKKLARFGFSNNSVTFWYEDQSWLKSQIYAEAWPDLTTILDRPCHATPLLPDFFTALAAVGPFSSNGNVYFDREVLRSHSDASTGASFDLPGLPAGPIFPVKQLKLIQGKVDTIDFLAPGPENTRMLKFYSSNLRGIVAGQRQ